MEFLAAVGGCVIILGAIWMFSDGPMKDLGDSYPNIGIFIIFVVMMLVMWGWDKS